MSGNVTTSATEAWCRTTLLAVSELGRGEWVGRLWMWGYHFYSSAFSYGTWGLLPALFLSGLHLWTSTGVSPE